MIKAVIFDMDGLLIDSEPLWQEAEMAVFATVGIHLTREMCLQTMGLRVDQVVQYWFDRYPWEGQTQQAVATEVVEAVRQLILRKGQPRPGVHQVLEFVKQKDVKIALASSSPMILIKAVTEKFQIADYFEELHSAETEVYGKPHPAVYITTAEKLGVQPDHCVAFEDSFNGLLSAKAARMRCVAVPDESLRGNKKLGIADLVLPSLEAFGEAEWEMLQQQ